MSNTLPAELPIWATSPNTLVEPADAVKALGWDVSDRPPAGWFNWWMNNVYRWIAFLSNVQSSNFRHCQSANVGNDLLYDICHGQNTWTAVGTDAGNTVQTSVDASVWVGRVSPSANSLYACGSNATHTAAVGVNGTLIHTDDPDGSWTENSDDLIAAGCVGDAWCINSGNGYWVIGADDGCIYHTQDIAGALSQFNSTGVTGGENIYDVKYIERLGIWVAVGGHGSGGWSGIMTSAADPTNTWTERTNPVSFSNDDWWEIADDGEYIYARGTGDDDAYLIRSADCLTWENLSSNLPVVDTVNAIAADGAGHVVINMNDNHMYMSNTHGTSWVMVDADGEYAYQAGAHNSLAGKFVFVGSDDVARSLKL